MTEIILTTTSSIEGKTIKEYFGIVSAQSNQVLDRTHVAQGVSGALDEVANRASELGADAVVGMQFVGPTAHYYDTIHIYGTAVKFK
ncbi:heavy metal-binding domain-containing protein [Candidatus Spongiihabitans sp.]|uniref:heavy metal-binding domain-containing protein n=1 Tax=Candidatus Spongiihabitans sp. TaxID=3101308 RepID=UPI003C6FAEA5